MKKICELKIENSPLKYEIECALLDNGYMVRKINKPNPDHPYTREDTWIEVWEGRDEG